MFSATSRMAVRSAIIFVSLLIAWLSMGRHLTLLFDRFIAVRAVEAGQA